MNAAARWPKRQRARQVAPGLYAAVPLEKAEQAQIGKFLLSIGGRVYVSGTRRSRGKACPKCGTFVPEHQGTRQTPGIPDVEAFLPTPSGWRGRMPAQTRVILKVEAKRVQGGRMSAEQEEY